MGRTFDFILAGAAIIVGIMLLTGHGDIFMKGGNTQLRKAKYDEKKDDKRFRRSPAPYRYRYGNRLLHYRACSQDRIYYSPDPYSCRINVISEI